MKNFEQNIETEINHPNLEKICLAKSRQVINAITESNNNYRINTPRVENKLAKAISEVLKGLNMEDSPENENNISNKIIKNSIEVIARDQAMGKISSFKDLEKKYLEILSEKALKLKSEGANFQDYPEIIDLVDSLDSHKILDNDSRAKLIEDLSKKLLFVSKN